MGQPKDYAQISIFVIEKLNSPTVFGLYYSSEDVLLDCESSLGYEKKDWLEVCNGVSLFC